MEKTIKYLENGEYHYATVKDVGDLAKLKTDSKDDLVAAINDLFENGGENAGKPEGYDNLVNNVADAIQKQQQISSTITNMQQTAQLSDAEMAHMKQVQEELRQEYLKAIKKLNEAVEKAKADAAALDKKTNDMQDKIDETFADVNKEVSDVHKQLDAEAKGLHKDLDETKTNLEATRKDLLNSTQEYGQVHSEVKELQDKFSRRVWSTDLDPVREQVSKNSTEVQQTKDELKNKADQSNLDLVTNSVENLSAQVKQNASGLEVAVKRDELGGDVARLLGDKTNLLLGTRSFSGEDNWKNRDTVTIEPGYYKGLKSAAVQVLDGSIYQPYRVKADTAYTFSFFAREDKDNPKAKLAIKPIDAKNINIDNEEQVVHITTEWQRFAVTFSVDKECDVSIQVIQGPEASNNVLHLAGLKLQYGQNNTPWEPNEADVAENIEHTESQFNVYSDQIAGIVKKQEKMGDKERQLDTRITETAKGLEQTSKDIQVADGKINEFNGKLESTAQGLKTEYEKYTNEAVGQISDSSLNLIHNSAFSNQDNQFESWQNISAKATVREDSNNLHWVELTQSGQGTDNPIGVTSNYFIVKQGKVTVAVDVKLGDKANLDNQNILLLELYDESKKRVDFTDVSVSQLGLSMSVLNDHNVHRGLYRLGIDRKDVKYMTVKAILHRNGDLWLTNFSARLSSIDDGGYTPNPDDVNHQILKMNTKIEEDAEHIALKANSVDVTRDIKSAVDGIDISGVNLLRNTDPKQIDEVESDSTWILGSFGNGSAKVIDLPNSNIFTAKHGFEIYGNTNGNRAFAQRPIHWTNNKYVFSVYARIADVSSAKSVDMMTRAWSNQTNRAVFENHYTLTSKQWTRVTMSIDASSFYDQTGVSLAFGLSGYGSIDFAQPMLELANKASKWSPNPQDTAAEIKSAKDAAIQVASDQINLHVNELSTQFDDKLNKRINEQKTAYEKITSDGIEQTVRKITDVKNDVNNVNSKLDNLQVGGRNLLHGTSDQWRTLTNDGDWLQKTTASTCWTSTVDYHTGNTFTYAAKITNNSHQQAELEVWLCDQNKTWINGQAFHALIPKGANAYDVSVTFPITADTRYIRSWVIFAGGNAPKGDSIQVKDERLVEGSTKGDWTPNPDDYKTQTLETADIDAMRAEGHFFVHNLTGNPIPGWVYVDVTGNGIDRIRQDVYADQSTKHMYRRLFGSSWSDWEQGAYISDVNNLKTEVTASVRNLGDRVTTEVNSITSKVNSNNGGGINLLRGTGSEWKTLTGSVWFCQTTGAGAVELGSFTTGDTVTYSITVRNNSQYAVRPEIVGFSDDNWIRSFNIRGTESVQPGETKTVSVSATVAENTVKIIGWLISSGAEPTFSVDAKNEKLERGSVATPWSPAPEDTAEAIKTLNTKWDVANGQIQAKVTATDVNNILNGKGYATQSWAQTMFTMKSDAITLQAVRDNITNGIQNQVNSIQGKLEGDLSNICRNPTFSHGVEGWNSSHLAVEGPWSEMPTPKNGTLFVRDAYYGDYFPVSKGERYYTSVFAHNGDSATFVLGLCFQLKDGSLSWLSGSNVPGLQTGKFDGYVDVPDNAVSAKIWVSIQKFDNFGWVKFTNVVVKKNDAISQINITPDQVKIASNKIEIDGNTYIHGELNVPTVKLNGHNGSIDLSGDGIHIGGPDGDIKLDSGGIDITKNGQGLSITGDYIQVVTDSNGQKEVTGLIGSNFNLKNNNQNGLALLVTPQQDLGRPYGGDILTIGTLQKSGEVTSAVTFDATNITGDGAGFHWTAPHYLHGPAQAIHITDTQDNLTLLPLKMPHSSQEGYYQPALTVTHGIDGNGNYVHGDSGVEFLWSSIKPYGSVDMTDARLWVYGVDHGIKNVWVSWSNWDGGERYPALVNDIGYWGGIAFPKSGRVTLFDADGRYYCPDRNTGIGAYNNYIGKNNNWH